jgi:nitrogen-specific signal transduction histidine kinase/CheY-like chemotaxis protein
MARANRELALRADALTDANAQLKTHMEEREKAQEVLRQSQKMEALGHLVGGVAHDFNNILTAIINNLELIRNHGTTGKAAEGRIESASAAALRGAGLIRQLMVFSRNEALEPRFLDAGAAIGDVLRMVEGSLPGNVVLDRAPSAEPAVVLADPAQLQTALLNVIFNARDAMPEGGTIRIETGTATRRGEGGDASFAVITVADTGSGIAPGDLPHIFEPFFTTKDVGKGTGLGLSQVFGFVKGAGGDIEVESEEGKGTTIRLLFPLHPASALPEKVTKPQPMLEEKDESHGGTVLFVEDDPFVAYASVDLLEESGFTVLSASRAKEALELLPQHDEVDLLITDIGLPEMNGHDLVAEARRAQPDLRVLFITGYDATSVAERTKLDTRTTILKKPYDPGALVQKVHAILEA